VVTKDPLLFDFWSAINNVSFFPFFLFFFFLSLSLYLPPGKFPELRIMNHGWGARGWYVPSSRRLQCQLLFCIIVYQPITPSSSVCFRIVVIVQVGFILGVRTTTLLGSQSFWVPQWFFITIFLLFVIYLTKFVVNVDQMGYLGVHNSSKLKIWFKVKNSLILYLGKTNAPCIVKSTI
jgi:hypothetical protein